MTISTSSNVLTIGHSLVGKTIPDMMNSMGHAGDTDYQLINGAPLVNSWRYAGESYVEGVNSREALTTGRYDAVIMTEAIPLETNVEWNDTTGNALNFVRLAHQHNADVQTYLYETWHGFNFYNHDMAAWRAGLDTMSPVWEGVVDEVNAGRPAGSKEMLLIPAGQAMATLYDAIEAGRIPGVTSIREFFTDNIHTNNAGSYYVVMVHQAALYGTSPVGLTNQTMGQHGPFPDVPPEMARILQNLAWETVNEYDRDGVNDGQSPSVPPVAPPVVDPQPEPEPEPVNRDIVGNSAANVLNGTSGNDRMFGYQGNDVLDGKAGADRMVGGAGNDTYFVDNAGDRTIELAGYGIDTVKSTISTTLAANVENLILLGSRDLNGSGNALNNIIVGNVGDNILRGGNGNDAIFGGAGNDVLRGGAGNDVLRGEAGADVIFGGAGKDLMFGGDDAARDVFIFRAPSDSRFGTSSDVVFDFTSGTDKFDFRQMDGNVRQAGDQDLSWSRSAAANSVWTVRDGEDMIVRGDVNGDRVADFAIRVDDVASLNANDFWL